MSRWSHHETPQPVVEHHTVKLTWFCQNPIGCVCQRPMTVSELMCGSWYLENISSTSAVVSSAVTDFFWYHDLDVGFQDILTSHVPGEPSAFQVAHISVEGVGVGVHIDDDMFFMLTNVQSGAVALQEPIDNRNGNLPVGLRSITYMVGWYNVGAGESISWRAPSNNESRRSHPRSTTVAPGLYGIEDLIKLLEEAANDRSARIAISTNSLNGLLTLTVTNGWEVQITNGLLTLLGLNDGRGGLWLDSGAYDGDRPVNFTSTKSLHVHLNQLNTTKNSRIVPNRPFSPVLVLDAMPLETFIQSASRILNSNASVVGLWLNWR